MFRFSVLARAARCHYEVLGVARTATVEDIKLAFREQAKKTHPDVKSSPDASRKFREMVDAYRVLRDPLKRQAYDRDGRSADDRGGAADRAERANMYRKTYAHAHQGYSGTDSSASSSTSGPDTEWSGFAISDYGILPTAGVFLLFGLWHFFPRGQDPSVYVDPDPYPRDNPLTRAKLAVGKVSEGGAASSAPSRPVRASAVGEPNTAIEQEAQAQSDESIRAFYNPYAKKWQWLPDGYDPPGVMDLSAWHKRRSPAEWAMMLENGTLSDIMPRGALQWRYVPAWETFEPAIVSDPQTGRTVAMSERLLQRGKKASATAAETCGVRF